MKLTEMTTCGSIQVVTTCQKSLVAGKRSSTLSGLPTLNLTLKFHKGKSADTLIVTGER